MLIRDVINDLTDAARIAEVEEIDDIVNYFSRQTDKNAIRDGIKTRYGYGIKKILDPGVSDENGNGLETYVREGFTEQVDAGMIEAISSGFGPKVVNALATLFTEKGQKYQLQHDTVEDLSDQEEELNGHRERGGYQSTMVSADQLSIKIGSSAVLVGYSKENLTYQKLSPADVEFFYAESGYINDSGEYRLVDMADPEDASAIRIRLSQVDATTWNYLLIMGRTDENPNGRYVMYQANSTGGEIPGYGDDGVFDYEIEGSPANPLSYYANQNPDNELPEYPIAIIMGGVTESDDPMPITNSLYNDCIELDIAASHLLYASQEAASGTLVLERVETGRNMPVPRMLTGKIALSQGCKLTRVDSDSQASVDGNDVLKQRQIDIASGYSVPDYMVVAEEGKMAQASSGVALQIKTRPLRKAREHRAGLNGPSIRKIFTIESSLLDLYGDGNVNTALLVECSQLWEMGDLKLPENKKEAADRIISLMDKGVLDIIEAIREYYQLATTEEAMEQYDRMKERATEYPPLVQKEEKRNLGLPSRKRVIEL